MELFLWMRLESTPGVFWLLPVYIICYCYYY